MTEVTERKVYADHRNNSYLFVIHPDPKGYRIQATNLDAGSSATYVGLDTVWRREVRDRRGSMTVDYVSDKELIALLRGIVEVER